MSEQFKSIETTELVKIANAIRTKTGTTDKISLEDMPAKIAAIESGGDTRMEDGLVTGTITEYSNNRVESIGSYAFAYCSGLTTLYLTGSSLCSLAASTAFTSTGIGSNKGYIYVPSSLVASYKAATNWAFFSNRIYSYLG